MEKSEKTILVTGSTGFLGSVITRRLLASGYKLRLLTRKRDNSASIISFGRRCMVKEIILGNQPEDYLLERYSEVDGRLDSGESLHELFLRNVEIYEGDITQNDLGLEKKEYSRLCYEVDEVFHCAAVTHFEMKGADEHAAVNVNGTENVLKFAESCRKKRIHYVSTAYVAGRQDGIIYENEMLYEPPFNNEYERSKFIAEQIVIRYAKSNDVSYTIYRPGIIVGDSRTGVTCRFDNFYTFVKVLFNIQKTFTDNKSDSLGDITVRVPGDRNALINLVPVDYAVDAIVAILKNNENSGKIFHITNPDPPNLYELRDLMLPVLGLDGVNVKIEGGLEQKHLDTMEKLFFRQTKTYYSYLFSKLRFDCRNTRDVLNGTGITCPAITRELIRVLVDFAVSRNWGEGKRTVLQKV